MQVKVFASTLDLVTDHRIHDKNPGLTIPSSTTASSHLRDAFRVSKGNVTAYTWMCLVEASGKPSKEPKTPHPSHHAGFSWWEKADADRFTTAGSRTSSDRISPGTYRTRTCVCLCNCPHRIRFFYDSYLVLDTDTQLCCTTRGAAQKNTKKKNNRTEQPS